MAERISYGPRRVPGASNEAFRPDYTGGQTSRAIHNEPLLGYILLEQSRAAVDLVGHRLLPVKTFDLK